ncbi:3-carboxy-cis,cis-muconate cycloisomerase [Microvirga rosea]|uniref:3-carboxy-cis,cis-muconate cycloisomerase n=1 Tax=Microvirga rosea TaxID=2715425 RepID=UPI001D0AF4DE|nr:3-carboxy-cis,cis-muconate cycloisomerase [Microvirga rosea]MCB8819887.1 3-carboxy-cis,cis-muconate cycloisomerase [Microvirga rosea]
MTASPLPFPILQTLVGDDEIGTLFSNDAELAAILKTEAALAQAQAEVGLISEAAASRVTEACHGFAPDWQGLAKGLARDGVVVPELVKQLRRAVEKPHDQAVHLGATSQDILDTALILRLKQAVEIFAGRLKGVIDALRDLKDREGRVSLMAHTRMQRALPFETADKIDTWLRPLQRQAEALDELLPHLLVIQLGGPIGTRAELKGHGDAVAAAMARRLDLTCAASWHSQRDRIGEFASWLSLVSGILGKFGQDLVLMAQNELAEVSLPSGGGSSAMAHKSNPVQAEVLIALARFNAGMLGILHQAMIHENERSGAAWTLEWIVLPQMVVTLGAALSKAQALAEGMNFSPSRP